MTALSLALSFAGNTPAPAWTPASISGLWDWLRADKGLVLSGSSVTTWTDQSSNAQVYTGAVHAPTLVASGPDANSQPSILFTRASGQYLVNSGALPTTLPQPLSIVIAYKAVGVNNTSTFCDGLTDRCIIQEVDANNIRGYAGSFDSPGALPTALTVFQYIQVDFNGSSSTMRQNGTLIGTTFSPSTSGWDGYLIGLFQGQIPTSYAFDGYISEVIAAPQLSSGDRASLATYMHARYGT